MRRRLRLLPALALAACAQGGRGAAAPSPAPGAADDYVLFRGADTVATERVVRDGARVRSTIVARGQGIELRLDFARAADERVDSLSMRVLRAGSDSVVQRVEVRFERDTAVVRLAQGAGPAATMRLPTQAGALPLTNLATSGYEQVVRRARALGLADTGAVEVPVFLLEGGRTMRARVRRIAPDSVAIVLGPEMRVAVAPDGRVLGAAMPGQGACVLRPPAAACPASPVATARPRYDAPADAPYVAHDVTLPGADGSTLAGTLTMPRERGTGGRAPVVLLLTGSGAQDRDEATPALPGYRPFRQLADTLGRRGIAVLRLDDRGVGGSAVASVPATIDLLARDAAAAIAWLRARPDVRGDRVAVAGHSEGGMVGPLLASRDATLSALVLIAAPSRSGRAVSDYQVRRVIERASPGAARDSALRVALAARDAAAAASPALTAFLDFDPAPALRAVRAPVLVVHGATDTQVPPEQAAEIESILRAAGNRDVTVRVMPSTNHLLLEDPSGDDAGYASLPSAAVRAPILGLIADWLVTRLR